MISNLIKRTVTATCLAMLFFIASPAMAMEMNVNEDGVALHGYDPVSYFTADSPTKGLDKFDAEHHGARYLFSSSENRDKFMSDPGRFPPQFGGYCAYGVRVGRKFDIDPDVYRVVDDKLYVQLNWGTQVIWLVNLMENIDVAHTLWPMIEPQTDEQLAAAAEKAEKSSKN